MTQHMLKPRTKPQSKPQLSQRLVTLALPLVSFALLACGSTHTVESRDVPLKEGSFESPAPTGQDGLPTDQNAGTTPGTAGQSQTAGKPPVQDIHQRYSLTYSAHENRTTGIAQFRVRTSRGDTIRFGNSSQVQFNGAALDRIDGEAVNAAVTLLNHLTIIPIFSLFRTGTFYSESFAGPQSGTFRFSDDFGNSAEALVLLPVVTPGSLPREVDLASAQQPFVASISLQKPDPAGEFNCTLRSKSVDSQGRETSELSTAQGTLAGVKGECSFAPHELRLHAQAREPIELKVEYSVSSKASDAFGRTKDVRATYVNVRTFTGR